MTTPLHQRWRPRQSWRDVDGQRQHLHQQLRRRRRRRPGQQRRHLTLTDCTVSGNSAGSSGGGLYNISGTATLTNCTVSGNSAGGNGGGLFNDDGTTTLTNCTVSGNSAGDNGGGLFNCLRHDHADQLHRQRQLRQPSAAAACSPSRHDHADQLHRQRQLRQRNGGGLVTN